MSRERFSIRDHIAIVAVLMVLVMTVLDVTLVNVSLPVLAVELGVSDSMTVWIVTVYQLVITMLLLPLSSAGDLFSYRSIFLTGVCIFVSASVMCALSDSFAMILMSRGIQGVGAACVMSVNIALTRLIYPREILGRGLALNAMVIAVATAAGPTLAGLILSVASWHWLFLINIPFGVLAFLIGKRLLPSNPEIKIPHSYDWRGAVENVVTFGLIFYSLGSFSKKGDSHVGIILLIAGLTIGYFYIKRQARMVSPLFPVDLLRIRLYSLSILTSICSFIAQNLAMISLPFLFLNRLGFSEVMTGFLMTPWSIATMITSPIAARIVEKHNPGMTAACGMAVYATGVLMLLLLPAENVNSYDVVWRMALCGIGFGLYQTPNNVVMVMSTPRERTGGAGGMQSTARLVGQTLGATVVTFIFALFCPAMSVRACLCLALIMAVIAGSFSLSRVSKIKRMR